MNTVTCAKCRATLLGENFNTGALAPCPACGAPSRVEIFPALFKTLASGESGESVSAAVEASCFYHPAKRAVVPCANCGRFLCELCDLDLNGKHLCPSCLASGKKKGRLRDLDRERVLHDNVALGLALLPILFWPLTLISGPAAIFVAIRYWNSPGSIVPRRAKVRYCLAILFGLAEIIGWIVLLYFIFYGNKTRAAQTRVSVSPAVHHANTAPRPSPAQQLPYYPRQF